MRRIALLLSILLSVGSLFAQRTVTVSTTYTYYVPDHLSLEQAKAKAIERAQTEAIANEFGTLIQQMGSTHVSNIDGKSTVGFSSVASSDVRGEWVQTIGKPQFDIDYIDNQMVVIVELKGKIREISYLKPQFSALLLRNGTKENCEDEEFHTDDYLYMQFHSPVAGYIALFAKDDSIRCLLPCIDAHKGVQEVKANKKHLFFTEYGERLQMFCATPPAEVNTIYILFSPNPITRPLSKHLDDGGLPLFSDAEFQRWLAKMRTHDKELQLIVKYITIKP